MSSTAPAIHEISGNNVQLQVTNSTKKRCTTLIDNSNDFEKTPPVDQNPRLHFFDSDLKPTGPAHLLSSSGAQNPHSEFAAVLPLQILDPNHPISA
jgi:hypothetical protein